MTTAPARPVMAQVPAPILIVDDDEAVRSLFARVLQRAGYATCEAADGVAALEVLERHPVALVLLDSTMPRLDGAGVIRVVRGHPATRTLPIILVTAKANLEDRILGLEAGADDYLGKPVALDELEARVGAQMRIHAAWTQALEQEARERRAMTSALRRIPVDISPERMGRALVAELTPALRLEALALATFSPDDAIVSLAVGGSWASRFCPGHALKADLARRLRERTFHGPWVIDESRGNHEQARGAGVMAVLPLGGPGDPFGMLALRAVPGRDGVGGFARRLPLFLELADAVAAMVRPGLQAGEARLQAAAYLESIIATRAFTPYFQAVVCLADRAILGYEALTRFADGVPPDVRFAEATRQGLGHEFELVTLAAATRAARGLPARAHLALNVSPAFVLASLDLPALLADCGRDIVLEITEHAPVDDYAALRAALGRIEPPVAVSVDDAGSGYASLRHILALRPAYVKLDLSWVRDIDADPARQALVAGLVHFAAETGCQLIGEGIETEAERDTLLRLGVPLGQGHLFGRPAPVTAGTSHQDA